MKVARILLVLVLIVSAPVLIFALFHSPEVSETTMRWLVVLYLFALSARYYVALIGNKSSGKHNRH